MTVPSRPTPARRCAPMILLAALALLLAAPPGPAQTPPPAAPPVVAGEAPAIGAPALPAPLPPATPPVVAQQAPAALPHDLSPWGMFMAADLVVKAVMAGLALAVLATLTVLVFKLVQLSLARAGLRRSLALILAADDLPTLARTLEPARDPAAYMARSVFEECLRSDPVVDLAGIGGLKERARSILDRVELQAGRHLMRGTGVLATIGSTAPFVGLFGTVWGIMNAFIGISQSQTSSLAVVAPGIAEALLATAMGLVAAIPAVVIYNACARAIGAYRARLGDAGAGVMRLLSRDLDVRSAAARA